MPGVKLAFSSKPFSITPIFLGGKDAEEFREALQRRIGDRAYAIYEKNGRPADSGARDWKQAESEILQRALQIQESGTWVAIGGSLSDVFPEEIKILVTENRAIVMMKEFGPRTHPGSEVFFVANLAVEVIPETAAASFKDGNLSLMIRKRKPAL